MDTIKDRQRLESAARVGRGALAAARRLDAARPSRLTLALVLSLCAAEPLRRVLAIGCHADDIEIGCGGTLLALTRAQPGARGRLGRARSGGRPRAARRARAPTAFLAGVASAACRGARLPRRLPPVRRRRGEGRLRGAEGPRRPAARASRTRGYDLHQDHRLACELTWNTFRNHLILEYEIPKFDGDLGRPNVFVPLDGGGRRARSSTLLERHFPSQAGKHWFDGETVPRADAPARDGGGRRRAVTPRRSRAASCRSLA